MRLLEVRKERSRFLKQGRPPAQAQKLLLRLSRDVETPLARIQRSLFGSFSSEKELLPEPQIRSLKWQF